LITQTPQDRSSNKLIDSVHLTASALLRVAAPTALVLLLIALWAITHRYKGLTGDAELYALQALSRIHPNLAADLYLQNVSQDQFTIFSPLYALCIEWLGLQNAALALTVLVTAWFLVAAWALARSLSNRDAAFLAVVSLIITIGQYGAFSVFRYSEDWLTARSLAEALVVTALACHFRGAKRWGLVIAAVALVVHPIMALPGILLLICLWLPLRVSAIGAGMGILTALGIAATALIDRKASGLFTVVDADWLEVVRERSQFLFLQLWTTVDWKVNARPFICLIFTALATGDVRIRKLCMAAMLVGFAGLAVALIAGLIGPAAILLQGQAWRWVWITCFVSVLLLAPTILRVWRDEKCGPVCAVLLTMGWTFTVIDGTACVALALMLWLLRERISERSARYLRWAAAALGFIVITWAVATTWDLAFTPSPESGRETAAIARIRNIVGLEVSAVMLAGFLFHWIRATRSVVVLSLISTALAVGAVLVLPGSFKKIGREGTVAEISEFADWRAAIPSTDTVWVVPMYNSATFAWFTLERPSYLSVDQSAGVVFSRATALEVRRRSQVLLPMQDPDWRILSKLNTPASGKGKAKSSERPLTRERLISVCSDTALDFVVAKEIVGFDPLRHTHVGDWKDWNLYDCHHVRSLVPTA
jgi:hypothetical protein